jgi:hypothetical protein
MDYARSATDLHHLRQVSLKSDVVNAKRGALRDCRAAFRVLG